MQPSLDPSTAAIVSPRPHGLVEALNQQDPERQCNATVVANAMARAQPCANARAAEKARIFSGCQTRRPHETMCGFAMACIK